MLGDLNEKEIQQVLENNFIGRIGCYDGDNVYIVPVNYLVSLQCVYGHSLEGRKIEVMRNNPKVCFEVEDIKSHTDWRTVIAWGVYEELTDDAEITKLRDHFSDQVLKLKASKTAMPPHAAEERSRDVKPDFARSVFYKIKFTDLSGRFEKEVR